MNSAQIRKRILARAALPLAVIALGQNATAQESGTLIDRGVTAGANGRSRTDARSVLLGFAACVTGRNPGRVQAMMALATTDPEYQRMHKVLFPEYSECLSAGGMREFDYPELGLRGAIFEALYRREFARSGPDALRDAPVIDYLKGYPSPPPTEAVQAIALARYGDCVARADPIHTRTVVLSIPASPEEREAFAALTPRLGPCLLKGEQLSFSKTILRGALSEGLYRVSVATAGGK